MGTVSNVTKSSGSLYYDITVEPLASVGSLEEVLVITSLSGDQQATADDATAANAQDRTTSTSATTAAATTDAAASDSSDQTDSSSSE